MPGRSLEVSVPYSLPVFLEYVEKPLKLVLKVGSGEVKEISTARATALPQSFHEDKSDHDKHKDKKKKKKKKEEKKVGPGEEKKKKKDEKKKKDRNQHESEAEKERKIQSPMRVDMPAVPVPESSLAKPEENQTPLQEALNQLVRQLQRKDPSAFFSFPVTDFIAPGYSMVIKNPMDFSTVKEKIKTNEYQSIEELKVTVAFRFEWPRLHRGVASLGRLCQMYKKCIPS
ncbi:hypothetical protein FKM82_022215 [Ascaphus truei]